MSDDPGRAVLSRRHVLAAVLACGALVATVSGRLASCAGCDYALFGIPLFAAGAAYYLMLGLISVLGGSLQLVGWISLPGVAVQAGLMRFLFGLGAPCLTCSAAAGLLAALSVACLWPGRIGRFAPAVVAAVGFAALPLWSRLLVETERLPGMPEFARMADLRSPPDRGTLLVVYEKEGCGFCTSFRDEYQPKLASEFGPAVLIRRIEAKDRHGLRRFPTFLIRTPDGSLQVVRGLPRYPDLAARLRKE